MKNIKKIVDKADDEVLEDLIKSCESRMAGKFKKKEEPKVEKKEKEEDDEELDEDTKSKLLKIYKEMEK